MIKKYFRRASRRGGRQCAGKKMTMITLVVPLPLEKFDWLTF